MEQHNAMSLEEFLNHTTSGGGSDTSFLKWRKRQPPRADVWLHTRAEILGLWQHRWARAVELSDKTTGEKRIEVWGSNFNCWESEALLKRQYFRDKVTGERKTPPTICPYCLLIEVIRGAVERGDLSWVAPIFQFDGSASDSTLIIHAGGIYNAYKGDDMTQEELKELKDARIFRTEAWRENGMAKCSFVFSVVDNDAPGDGVLVSIEGSGLGDKVKATIRDRMTSLGNEDGHPFKNPYAIRFEHRPTETNLNERYRAVAMERIPLSDEIRRLIVDEPPPDTSHLTKPGNPKKLRASMEAHYCGPEGLIDWDAVFGPSEEVYRETASEENDDSTSFDYGANAVGGGDSDAQQPEDGRGAAGVGVGTGRVAGGQEQASTTQQPAVPEKLVAPPGDEVVACDDCGKPMLLSWPKCPNCGKVYEEQEPPPPKPRSRAAAAAAKTGGGQQRPKPAKPDGNADWGIGPDQAGDKCPF